TADRLFLHKARLRGACPSFFGSNNASNFMRRMRQAYFGGHGGAGVIRKGEAAEPGPCPGQGFNTGFEARLNVPTLPQTRGVLPPPRGESNIPGFEFAGRVVARGEGVSAPCEGAEVCALVGSGGYAEYALAHAALCLPVPHNVGVVEAAGLSETYFTVFDNVF